MNKLLLTVVSIVFLGFLFSSVNAQIPPPTTSVSSNGFSLGPLSAVNSSIYAAFFAIVLFIVFAIALDRTQLSSGRIAISLILGLITFFVLYTNSTLLHFFLNTFIVLAFIALILGMLAAVKSPRSIKLIGLVVALFLIYILFANDSGLTNFIDSFLHIDILQILPLILGAVAILTIIILILRAMRNHKSIGLRAVLAFIILMMIVLLIPGFASFLFNPVILIILIILIILVIIAIFYFGRRHPRGPRDINGYKKPSKEAKLQNKVLSSINDRKAANADVLKEYKELINKGNLTPNEQLRVAQLKNKLANEAWKNVADRTKLTQVQYSKSQLSNNRDLQKLTGFFSRNQALRDLKSEAKKNYKLSWSERRALKNRERFIKNSENPQAGDIFDLANSVRNGSLGNIPSEKAARKIFERRLSKEARNKDVSSLLNERNKILDPSLNLSDSTRRKLLAKLDKDLRKVSPNISPDKINQKRLIKEQKEQLRQEMLEDKRLQEAQLEAARKNAEKERQRMSEEQSKSEGGAPNSSSGPGNKDNEHFIIPATGLKSGRSFFRKGIKGVKGGPFAKKADIEQFKNDNPPPSLFLEVGGINNGMERNGMSEEQSKSAEAGKQQEELVENKSENLIGFETERGSKYTYSDNKVLRNKYDGTKDEWTLNVFVPPYEKLDEKTNDKLRRVYNVDNKALYENLLADFVYDYSPRIGYFENGEFHPIKSDEDAKGKDIYFVALFKDGDKKGKSAFTVKVDKQPEVGYFPYQENHLEAEKTNKYLKHLGDKVLKLIKKNK